jgi:hypothetical protein
MLLLYLFFSENIDPLTPASMMRHGCLYRGFMGILRIATPKNIYY